MIFNKKRNDINTYELLVNNQSDLNNINIINLKPGCKAHCIANNKNYILSANKQWYELPAETGGFTPTGTYNIAENGVYNILNYANVNVNVQPEDDYLNITNTGVFETGLNYCGVNVNIPVMSTRFDNNTNTLYIRDDGQIA